MVYTSIQCHIELRVYPDGYILLEGPIPTTRNPHPMNL